MNMIWIVLILLGFLPLSTVFGWTLVLVYLLLCVSPFESSDNWRRRWEFPETNKVISSSLAFCPDVDQLYPSGLIIAVLYSHDPKFVSCISVFIHPYFFQDYSTWLLWLVCNHHHDHNMFSTLPVCFCHTIYFCVAIFLAITYYLHHNAFCNIFCNNLLISVSQCYLHLDQLYQQCHCHTVSVQLRTRYNHLDAPRHQQQINTYCCNYFTIFLHQHIL